jgi:hypothetical protein
MKAALAMNGAATQPANSVSFKPVLDSLAINVNADTVSTSVSVPYTLIQQAQATKFGKPGVSADANADDSDDTQPAK